MENATERFISLEKDVKQNTKDIEAHGGVLDNLQNTVDSILMPGQKVHQEKIVELREKMDERAATEKKFELFLASQQGARAWIKDALLLFAALGGIATTVLKIFGGK